MDDEARMTRSRPIWPWALGMIGALAIGAAAYVWWPHDPSPARVLVAVHGVQGEPAAALSGALRRQLGDTFDVVSAESSPADLASARAAALERGAGHALLLEVELHERRDGSERDPAYASASVRASLWSASGEEDREIGGPRISAHAPSADAALTSVAQRSADALAASILVALLERRSVVTYTTERVDAEEIPRQQAIRARIARLPAVREEIARMDRSCRDARVELAADGGEARCISQACAEEYAFDLLPDGSAALVHAETPGVGVTIERAVAERIETEETLSIVPLDGSTPRVIARADNYYTYPSLSGDGRRVAAVEEWGASRGLVVIDVESGARTVLARSAQWIQSPRLSPDGAFVTYHLRETRRGRPQLAVMPSHPDGAVRFVADAHVARWVRFGDRAWIAELVEWARVGRPPSLDAAPPATAPELPLIASTLRLALYDPASGDVGPFLDDDRHQIRELAGTWDGRLVFTWENGDACGVGVWDPTAAATFTRTALCLDHPSATPDGHVVGTARVSAQGDPSAEDDEVVEVSLADGSHRALTINTLRDRYPRAAGAHVVFDRVGAARARALPWVATCWLARERGGEASR